MLDDIKKTVWAAACKLWPTMDAAEQAEAIGESWGDEF
jgi:hypothetical protein